MGEIDRREFIKNSAATVAITSACLCGLGGCATYTGVGKTPTAAPGSFSVKGGRLVVDLTKELRLGQPGGAVKILHPDFPDGLIIARVAEDRFEVLSLLCTHRGVEVDYDHEHGHFQCASIGSSTFAFDGLRMSGPARRPLTSYQGTLDDGRLIIGV
ncbi:MAG: Rieske 2Fe-2S domain-containing protein [Woeseiaceae bacterium]|nr:Rieske 2Fe-2S domain-containing protein [Woeseiaceae bacterium]